MSRLLDRIEDGAYWLQDAKEGDLQLGPVVVLTRRKRDRMVRAAFELGMDAAPMRDRYRPEPPRGRRKHLHAV